MLGPAPDAHCDWDADLHVSVGRRPRFSLESNFVFFLTQANGWARPHKLYVIKHGCSSFRPPKNILKQGPQRLLPQGKKSHSVKCPWSGLLSKCHSPRTFQERQSYQKKYLSIKVSIKWLAEGDYELRSGWKWEDVYQKWWLGFKITTQHPHIE